MVAILAENIDANTVLDPTRIKNIKSNLNPNLCLRNFMAKKINITVIEKIARNVINEISCTAKSSGERIISELAT